MNTINRILDAVKLSCLAFILLFSSCSKSIDNQTTLFKDVNVISMVNDSILHGQSVLVKDGKIADIGIFDKMTIPPNTNIIESEKQYLIPGLCDMHVHYNNEDDRLLYVANGVTFVRNMFGAPAHLKLREKIKEKRIIGPELYTTGPIIDGENPFWPGSYVISDKAKVPEALYQMKKDGYDAFKVYWRLTKDVYDEITKVAKELDMPVVGHVPKAVYLKHALFSGQSSIEHLDAYENYFADEQIIKETLKSGIWNCPTLVVLKKLGNNDSLNNNPPKEIKYVAPNSVAWWKTGKSYNAYFEQKTKLLKTLADNNANIVTGTDVSNPYTIAGFSLHEELSIWQDAGIAPYQILLSSTRKCAEMIGEESRLGTIEKGKDADLVLLKKNPLKDINNTKSIVGVMTKGSWYPESELKSMLAEIAAKNASGMQRLTIRNSYFIKSLLLFMFLSFLSTLIIRPFLFFFNKNKLEVIKAADNNMKKYYIRTLVIVISSLSLILLLVLLTLPEFVLQSGISIIFITDLLTRIEILLPSVILLFLIALCILYSILWVRNNLSLFRKWHTLSVISAATILLVLLNYWGLFKMFL